MKKLLKNRNTTNFLSALGCLAALLIAFAQTTTAQETALDYNFGTNGRAINNAGSFNLISSVAVQADGNIVTGGRSSLPGVSSFYFAVARYVPNGALDGTFGENGIRVLDNIPNPQTGAPLIRSLATTVLIQPDGKIVLTGLGDVTLGSPRFFVAVRLNPNGAYDSSFGTNGRVVTRVPNQGSNASDTATAVLQTDGKIVIAADGVNNTNRKIFSLIRYNADGTIDTSYGTGGFVAVRFSPESNVDAVPQSLVLQPDGKIIAAGSSTGVPSISTRTGVLARLNTNGTLDSTFGTSGLAVDTLSPTIYEIALLSDGKIIAVNSQTNGFGLARYNANGSIDQTFGDAGRIRTLFGSAAVKSTEVLVQPDGKIVVSGKIGQPTPGWAFARYNPDGSLDRTFGTGGRVIVANAPFDSGEAPDEYDITLQPDGKILAGGGQSSFYLVRLKARNTATEFDFDGDARADASVFRPSNGFWYLNRTTSGFYAAQFGAGGDNLAPADYDGDGRADIAVWRGNAGNPEFSYFYILQSSNNTVRAEQFGSNGDNPVAVGDWDADGKADLAVYRASNNFFYYRPSSAPGTNFVGIQWGAPGDVPTRGDFDGDGRTDAAVFRPSNGIWYVRQSSNGQLFGVQFGAGSDKPVAGDFDGDGRTDVAVFRPSNGVWYIRQSSNSQIRSVQYGLGTDKLVAADYDGDGRTDIAVWREGIYYILQSGNSQTSGIQFGATTDVPAASAFVQ